MGLNIMCNVGEATNKKIKSKSFSLRVNLIRGSVIYIPFVRTF